MSSAVHTIKRVSRLLSAFPGIAVTSDRLAGNSAVFEITSSDHASALAIQTLCVAANTALQPNVLVRDPANEARRSFLLSASTNKLDSMEFGYLQLLGIHIVWHLHSVGAISASAADDFLERWNAARVGA